MARVLLVINGSDIAAEATARAVALLGTDHEYTALSVVRPSLIATIPDVEAGLPGSMDEISDGEPDPAAVMAQSARAETEALDDIERATHNLHVKVRPKVEIGDPGETVCRIAESEHADVIVLGSHGRGVAQRLFTGSVHKHILQHARCLVLVLGEH